MEVCKTIFIMFTKVMCCSIKVILVVIKWKALYYPIFGAVHNEIFCAVYKAIFAEVYDEIFIVADDGIFSAIYGGIYCCSISYARIFVAV